MREIKFRAWHIGLKKMFSAEEMAKDQLTLLTTGKFINVSSASTKLSQIIEDMIPLQFTGVCDKNDIKIYEGDIVEWDHGVNETDRGIDEIIFNEGSFKLGKCYGYSLDSFQYRGSTWLKIIGNIYEDPELLGDDNDDTR